MQRIVDILVITLLSPILLLISVVTAALFFAAFNINIVCTFIKYIYEKF